MPGQPVLVDAVIHQPLAPWWKRLVAIILDVIVVFFGFIIITLVFAAVFRNNTDTANGQTVSSASRFAALAVLWLVVAVPSALYYAIMNGSRRGQTVGKMALGIAVRDARNGEPIGFWRALGRYVITLVFSVALYVPYILDSLAPLWDGRRQAWHDKVAHSVVIDLKP